MRWGQYFFRSAASSASLSSIVSANSFFNRDFSRSIALRRLASETSMPPNLLPSIERGITKAVLAAQLLHRHTGLGLFQKIDDLLFGKPLLNVRLLL
jgi:hypothetical protein